MTPLPELLRDYVIWQQMLYGIILMLFMRFIPDGIVGLLEGPARALWRRVRRTASEDRSEGATAEP